MGRARDEDHLSLPRGSTGKARSGVMCPERWVECLPHMIAPFALLRLRPQARPGVSLIQQLKTGAPETRRALAPGRGTLVRQSWFSPFVEGVLPECEAAMSLPHDVIGAWKQGTLS